MPTIISFKDKLKFIPQRSDHQVLNLFQTARAQEHRIFHHDFSPLRNHDGISRNVKLSPHKTGFY